MKEVDYLDQHKVIENALSEEVLQDFSNYVQLLRGYDRLEQEESGVGLYGDFVGDSILMHLLPVLEQNFGKKLYPTYSYARIYNHGGILKKHVDRSSCEYSATLTIDYEAAEQWPIYVRYGGQVHEVFLDKGTMLLYKGIEMPHWRDQFEGKFSMHIFLHYVAAEGELNSYKHDERMVFSYVKDVGQLIKNRLYSLKHLNYIDEETVFYRNQEVNFQILEAHPFERIQFANKFSVKYFSNLRKIMHAIFEMDTTFSMKDFGGTPQEKMQLGYLMKQLVLGGLLEIAQEA